MRATPLVSVAILLAALPASGASVTGTVECGDECGSTIVYLEGGSSAAAQEASVLFDQKNKVFLPHVLPIQRGSTVRIANNDPFLHNVHVYRGKDTVLNIALPFQGMEMPHKFDDLGTYKVSCDAHPEMSAYIVVLDNALFSALGEDGSYEMDGVAPGDYTLVVYNLEKDQTVKSALTVQ